MTAVVPDVAGVATDTSCAHCMLPVPSGLIEAGEERQFCCTGCRTAFAMIAEHGLGAYYDIVERRDGPVVSSHRSFEEFDHAAFRDLYVRATPDGLSQVDLYLEGVHCGACVWLVERVPLVVPAWCARSSTSAVRSRASCGTMRRCHSHASRARSIR